MKEQRWFVADQMTTSLLNSSGEVRQTKPTGIFTVVTGTLFDKPVWFSNHCAGVVSFCNAFFVNM